MVRKYWLQKIEDAWKEKSVIWLTGVRRTGKSTLSRQLTPDGYFDCELPRVRKLLEDPEAFFQDCHTPKITLDEIHRLDNASETLKIAADHFPNIKVLATGSSTLAATKKFKDSLTDRKREIFLTPMALTDLQVFKNTDIEYRLIRGGLPPFFLADTFPERAYQDWLDSFWAKDIEELFKIEKKHAFLKFFELLALQSGGMFEAKSFATPCGVSHTTIATYLNVMSQTHIAYILRPFHRNQTKEIISAPKVYFFDTGFIHFFKGIESLHPNDRGIGLEHLTLNEMLTQFDRERIHYWRNKDKNEIDFIIKLRGKPPIAIECKWNSKEFNHTAIRKFREIHPLGKNILVTTDVTAKRIKKFGELDVEIVPLSKLLTAISG
jgi:predicted AAA+ superfamily ATPase